MSRDRLAQLQADKRRAQGYAPQPAQSPPQAQQTGGYEGARDPTAYAESYQGQGRPGGVVPSQGSYAGPAQGQQQPSYQGGYAGAAGGASGYPQAQGQPPSGQYEMQQLGGQQAGYAAGADGYGNGAPTVGRGNTMQEFFGEIELISQSLQQLKNNISQISTLHTTVLNSATNEARQEAAQRELDQLTLDTSRLTNNLKLRIKNLSELNDTLPNVPGRESEKNTRRMQVAAQKKKFMDLIQEYREVEAKSRDKYRQRMERQYKIVKPDATVEEIRYAMDTDQGSQVFANALTQSTRYADARSAYREVQERHEDIKKIAQTMQELQQLFNDMAMLVERQDEQIQTIEETATGVDNNMAQAHKEIEKGVKSARKARKKRIICFFVILIIIIAIVLAVTLSVLSNQKKL